MIKLDILKNHPHFIPELANIWYDVLGKEWSPEVSIEEFTQRLHLHLNDDSLPLTLVAIDGDKPVGMGSLRETDSVLPDLTPWLGSLVVDRAYQDRGIGRMLINAVADKARAFNFEKLYLLAFDPTLPEYYKRLKWHAVKADEYKGYKYILMELNL